jgi:hypothetical protein
MPASERPVEVSAHTASAKILIPNALLQHCHLLQACASSQGTGVLTLHPCSVGRVGRPAGQGAALLAAKITAGRKQTVTWGCEEAEARVYMCTCVQAICLLAVCFPCYECRLPGSSFHS